MPDVAPILDGARGFFQDAGKADVPPGHVWDMVDYVPEILGAPLRGRGRWQDKSDVLPFVINGLIYAPFKAGDKLLACNAASLRDIPLASVGSTIVGTIATSRQNPVFHRDRVIIPLTDGVSAAKSVTWDGATFTISDLPASAVKGRYATVFKDRVILAGPDASPSQVGFSKPGDPTLAWDSASLINTSLPVAGLAAQRNQILVFHSGSVERIRGTVPPDSSLSDPFGDMILDSLFDRAGCFDARSIAYWNDNIIFADARGVHITDGAIVRNMCAQGGIESFWRKSFHEDPTRGPALSVAGGVFRDFYIVTLRSTSGSPITLAVNIPTRKWMRFSNINSVAYAFAVGSNERLYGTNQTTQKVIDLSPIFNPDPTVVQTDGNGIHVLPSIETGYQKVFGRRAGFRRFLDLLVGYEAPENADSGSDVMSIGYTHSPSDTSYETIGGLRQSSDQVRRKVAIRRRLTGIQIRIQQTLPTKDTRLYDIGATGFPEEENQI